MYAFCDRESETRYSVASSPLVGGDGHDRLVPHARNERRVLLRNFASLCNAADQT